MSENKDNKLTLINEKTANDYLTHTNSNNVLTSFRLRVIMVLAQKVPVIVCQIQGRIMHEAEKYTKGRRNASGP